MNIVIDLILVLVLAGTIFSYAKNGFIKSVIKAGRFIVSLILAFVFTPTVSGIIVNSGMYPGIKGFVQENLLSSTDKISEAIVNTTAEMACKVIAFIAILIIANVLIAILGVVLEKLFTVPVLKQFNTIAGAFLGVVFGILNVLIVSSVIGMLFDFGILKNGTEIAKNTIIFRFVSETDLVSFFVNLVSGKN